MRGIVRTAGATIMAAVVTLTTAAATSAQAGQAAADNPGRSATHCPLPDGSGAHPNCRLAKDGSIRVLFGQADKFTAAEADAVIVETWEALRLLGNLGLENATASADNVIQIIIKANDGDPLYDWKTGYIYIGEGTARKLGGNAAGKAVASLRHELIHLIQGRAYYMSWGRVFDAKTWWLEATAEMLPFHIDPAAAGYNAETYGSATLVGSPANISQYAPHRWPDDDYYQHAQRLYAATCAAGCVFTLEQVIEAINKGVYPFEDAARKAAFTKALPAYATYLITGAHPDQGIVEPIAAGGVIGDRIAIVTGDDDAGLGVNLKTDTGIPQVYVAEGSVTAPLEADSVYMLTLTSGAKAQHHMGLPYAPKPGTPVMFHVEPGPEFWYRVDDGAIAHHDGASELVLGPLHSGLGIGEARIVAVATSAPATFRGTFYPVDLAGDWVFTLDPKKTKIVSKACTGDGSKTFFDKPQLLDYISRTGAGHGAYQTGSPSEARWVKDGPIDPFIGRWHKSGKTPKPATIRVAYSASLDLGASDLTGELAYVSPPLKTKQDAGAILDVRAEFDLESLAYVQPAASGKKAKANSKAKAAPTMVATGKAKVETVSTVQGIKRNNKTKGKDGWQLMTCTVRMEGPVTAERYPDGVVKEPKIR